MANEYIKAVRANNTSTLGFVQNRKRFFIKDLYKIFIKPEDFFTILKYHPRILAPWLYISFVVLLSYFTLNKDEINFELKYTLQTDIAGDIDTSVKILQLILILSKPALIANALLISIIGFLWVKKTNKISYKQTLSLMLYGEVIFFTGVLISLPITLLTDNLYPLSLVPLALAYGYDPSSVLFFLALKLNPFFIYEIIYVGIGITRLLNCELKTGLKISILSVGLISVTILFFKILLMLVR